MFWHNYRYALQSIIRKKSSLIWTLVFPVALTTFMYMAFGELYEKEDKLSVIPVAVVSENEGAYEEFDAFLDALSADGDERLLDVQRLSEDEAEEALAEEKVDGVIFEGAELSLRLRDNSFQGTVLKTVLEQYLQSEAVVRELAASGASPQELLAAVETLTGGAQYYTETSTSNGSQNLYNNFFYAIFAMSCLFASFVSVVRMSKLQANLGALGMRRQVSPVGRMTLVGAEFAAMLTVQFAAELLTLGYMLLLGVELSDRYAGLLAVLFLGSCVGIAEGIIIGSIPKRSESVKEGICVSISMLLSCMADLVAVGIKDSIEHSAPMINRINPAALLTDAFYALDCYDTPKRFLTDLGILAGITALLLAASGWILRRNRYASL